MFSLILELLSTPQANQANDPRDIGRPPLPRCQWRRKSLEFASVDEGSSALPPSLISRHVDSHETTPCSNDGRFRGGAWGEHTQKYSPAAGLWEARSPQSRQSSESYWKIDSGSSVASWESEETDTASCRDAPWAKLGDLFITDRIGDIDADAHDLGAEGLPVSLPILPAATDSDDADSAKLLSAPSSPKVPDLPCAPAPAYDALALHHWLDDVRLSSIRGRTPKGSGSESSSLSYRERPPPGGDHDASGMLMLDPDALLGAGAPPEKPDPATWALRLRDQRSPPRHHSCCETNCDRILPETCRKASSAREQEIGRLERRLGPTSNERAFPHATAPGAALVPHESLFWPRLASVIAEAEAAEESQPGVIKRARSALALLLSGSEISTNGLRAHHIEALTLLLIPLELRAVGVSLSLRREHIALVSGSMAGVEIRGGPWRGGQPHCLLVQVLV